MLENEKGPPLTSELSIPLMRNTCFVSFIKGTPTQDNRRSTWSQITPWISTTQDFLFPCSFVHLSSSFDFSSHQRRRSAFRNKPSSSTAPFCSLDPPQNNNQQRKPPFSALRASHLLIVDQRALITPLHEFIQQVLFKQKTANNN